ncbi:SDR family oxidoreductase [Streptomyces sp. NPDC054796]
MRSPSEDRAGAKQPGPRRSVLVTGGNRGIGLATALRLRETGHKVAVTYRRGAPPEGFFAVRCDIRDNEELTHAVKQVKEYQGAPEIIVANAGMLHESAMNATSDADFDDLIETNTKSALRLARLGIGGMLRARWGRLIYISSMAAFSGAPGVTAYAASKAALLGMTRTLAWELGRHGITVNVVVPGIIDTEMTQHLDEDQRDWYLRGTPLARTGTADEVAAAVGFLADESASFITGATVPVSGGLGVGL